MCLNCNNPKTRYMHKGGERVMNNRVNLDNSPGKSLNSRQFLFFLTLPVPQVLESYTFAQSHRGVRAPHGTSSIYSSELDMGTVPQVSESIVWHQTPRCLKKQHRTGPKGISQPCMGLNAKGFTIKSYRYKKITIVIGPMIALPPYMGLVP